MTHTQIVRMATENLGRYPLVKPLGSIAPFMGYHPTSLLFNTSLWIGESACLVQFSHVLYGDLCADVLT